MTTDTRAEADEVRALVAQSGSKMLRQYQETMLAQRAEAMQYQALLTRQGPAFIKDCTPGQVLAFCRVAAAMQLNPLTGEIYLIHSTPFIGVAGRRVIARRTKVQLQGRTGSSFHSESPPRLLSAEEQEIYGVRDGDVARAVLVKRRDEFGGELQEWVGIGIVRRGEIESAQKQKDRDTGEPFRPIGRDPERMAAKRAAADAYKRGWPEVDIQSVETVPYDVDGEFVDVQDDAVAGVSIEQAQVTTSETDEVPAAPLEQQPEPPQAEAHVPASASTSEPRPAVPPESPEDQGQQPAVLPITDLPSLIGYIRDTYGKPPEDIAAALGGKVTGDIARLVRQQYDGHYDVAARVLARLWGEPPTSGRLL